MSSLQTSINDFFFFFFLHDRRNLLRKNPDKDVVTEGQKAFELRAGSEQSRTGHERKVQQAKQAEIKDKKRKRATQNERQKGQHGTKPWSHP